MDLLAPESLVGARRPFDEATALPGAAFTSARLYDAERTRLFEHGWLCAGRVDQVPAPGDVFPIDLLGDKLLLAHGEDGRVRVLSRVCRHRGAELVSEPGNTRSLQCPYHSWSYDLEGRLRGAPLMKERPGFDRDAHRLPELRSEIWEGWVFVNADAEAEPLGPQLAPLSAALAPFRMAEQVAMHTATYASAFNWKVLVDNFMEAYHHIATHRDTLEPIFPAAASSVPDNDGPYSLLRMPTGNDDGHELVAAVVYPFHLFAPSAQGLTWYQLLPHAVDRFELRIYSCFPRELHDDAARADELRGFQALTRTIHEQDIGACEATFAGLGARSYEPGPLAPLEKAIWQFNQWWIERMADA